MSTFNPAYLNANAFYATPNPVIQVLFPSDWPSYYTGFTDPVAGVNPAKQFVALSADQQSAIRLALSVWSSNVSVTFTDGDADGKKLSFGFTDLLASGLGYYPVWPTAAVQGDVFFNTGVQTQSFTPTATSTAGRANYWLALHEIGHALGLDHDQSGARNGGASLPVGEDNTLYTVMSYNDYASGTGRRPITPMLYDIAQLQLRYGANTTYNAGDTEYKFTDTTHPFTAQGITARPDQVLMTLWDAGGSNDVLDASGVTTSVKLDLREGEFSAIGTDYKANGERAYNVGIAFDTKIENATGGSGSDTLIGNALANRLDGGKGSDLLQGGAGDDTYIFTRVDSAGFGADAVVDSDGLGKLQLDGGVLAGGGRATRLRSVAQGQQLWLSADRKTQYSFIPNTPGQAPSDTTSGSLIIHQTGRLDRDAQITVKNWRQGQLGITLGVDAAIDLTPQRVVSGDLEPQITTRADGARIYSGDPVNAAPGFSDVLAYYTAPSTASDGTALRLKLEGLGGNDALIGGGAADELDGGDGDDLIAGGLGANSLVGGNGNDVILASFSPPVVRPSSPDDNWKTRALASGISTGNILSSGASWGVYKDSTGVLRVSTLTNGYDSAGSGIRNLDYYHYPAGEHGRFLLPRTSDAKDLLVAQTALGHFDWRISCNDQLLNIPPTYRN